MVKRKSAKPMPNLASFQQVPTYKSSAFNARNRALEASVETGSRREGHQDCQACASLGFEDSAGPSRLGFLVGG